MRAITISRVGYGPEVIFQVSISYALKCMYMTSCMTTIRL